MKTRSCDLVWRVGTVDSATPRPDPCGDKPPRYRIPAFAGMTRFAGVPGTRTLDGKRLFSYQSLMPAGAGTAGYENPGVVIWYGELARWILPRPAPTPAGDKPLASRSLRPRYIFSFRHRSSVYNSARFARGGPALRLIGVHIPDRSPGHAFVRMTNEGAGMTRFARVPGTRTYDGKRLFSYQ